MGELNLINRIRAASPGRNRVVRRGIGDDCAVLHLPKGMEILITTDLSLEGRHFRRDWQPPESVGHRSLARALSDVAAMGGRPIAAFLSLAMPREFDVAWVDGFMAGFNALAKRFNVELAGGDTAESAGEEIAADVVMMGAVEHERAFLRSGAEVGDLIYCSGQLGGAAKELEVIAAGEDWHGEGHPHLFPMPRVGIGRWLMRRRMATSCIDLSDGLSTDLRHLCEASGVGAALSRVPICEGATEEQALNGGEDYELLFTVKPWARLPKKLGGAKLTMIGVVVAKEEGIKLNGVELVAGGWEHFGG